MVRKVLPSVVLIRTATGLGSGVVQALAAKDPGQNVTVTLDRNGQALTAQVTLGELPGG